MKKIICLLLVLLLFPVISLADLPDLSGLSFNELITLREQVNLSLWNSSEWQEVEVPAGFYSIGKDIPAGHWTIIPAPDSRFSMCYFDKANDSLSDVGPGWDSVNGWNGIISSKKKNDGSWKDPDYFHSVDLVMKEGWFIILGGPAIFTPYTGKPDLVFK